MQRHQEQSNRASGQAVDSSGPVQADAYTDSPLTQTVARANRAAVLAERASFALHQAGDASGLVAYKRARELAALTAKLEQRKRAVSRGERYQMALAQAECVTQAEALASGLAEQAGDVPADEYTAPGLDAPAEAVAQHSAKRAEAQALPCKADPSKRASASRYKKGACRCDHCREAQMANQRAKRAAKG